MWLSVLDLKPVPDYLITIYPICGLFKSQFYFFLERVIEGKENLN